MRNYKDIRARLETQGVNFDADFHAHGSALVCAILDEANSSGYRQPKNANGSRARYFFYLIKRKTHPVAYINYQCPTTGTRETVCEYFSRKEALDDWRAGYRDLPGHYISSRACAGWHNR